MLLPIASFGQKTINPNEAIWRDINGVHYVTEDSLELANEARPIPGSTRKGNNPVIFLVGNSTMRTGTRGNGENGQWGWGYAEHKYYNADKVTVENHALGGTSPRTFYKNPTLWKRTLSGVRKGDFVFLELGHNDNGPIDTIRARSSYLPEGKLSISPDSTIIFNKMTQRQDTVYTFGGYIRRFVNETRAQGGIPVLFTLTPRNAREKDSDRIQRKLTDFTPAIFALGNEMKVPVVDLNDISATKLEKFSKWKVDYHFYLDKIHTSAYGARLNAESAAQGIEHLALDDSYDAYERARLEELKTYLLKEKLYRQDSLENKFMSLEPNNYDKDGYVIPKSKTAEEKKQKTRVFLCGDSTGKNKDKELDGMWGWGSQGYTIFDESKCTFINAARAGRSLRTYNLEGLWHEVYTVLRPGDYVLIQFGHNDIGPINSKKERGEIACAKDTSHVYRMESTGKYKVIYSFGWYLRKMIDDCKEKGAIPIILSFTPRNSWHEGDGKVHGNFYPVKEKLNREYIERRNDNYIPQWCSEIAKETNVEFVDVLNITADWMDKYCGMAAVAVGYYNHDHTHCSLKGARVNAGSVAKGLKKNNSPLTSLLKKNPGIYVMPIKYK
jgi:lysophospholipase L1-like esterase